MKRLLALLIVATIAGGTAVGQNQGSRLGKTTVVRQASKSTQASAASAARPSQGGRVPARYVADRSLLESAPAEEEVYYDDYAEPISSGEYVSEGAYVGGGAGCDTCGPDSCGLSCGSPMQFDSCNNYAFDGRQLCLALPSHGWVSVEYLMWYQDGMETPPLVTSSPTSPLTSRAAAGVLPGATTLFGGNNDILSDRLNGMRVRFGWWFVNNPKLGIEGEYVGTAKQTESYDRASNGSEILARPFYNVLTGREDAELVSYPNVVAGRMQVDAESQFSGAAVRFRRLLCCSSGCAVSPLTCGPVPSQSRIDATLGWRYFELDERLNMRETLTSLDTTAPGNFVINDSFRTRNQFNGAEVGVLWQGQRGYWSLDALMRLGIGSTHQTVTIAGSTATTQNGSTTTANGGLLAQRTNSGTFQRDQFTMIPELGATLGYQLTQNLRFTAGYSLIYWSNVVRPGNQIDRNVNPNLLPPESPTQTTFLRPTFAFQQSDYWIQGLSLGGEYRW